MTDHIDVVGLHLKKDPNSQFFHRYRVEEFPFELHIEVEHEVLKPERAIYVQGVVYFGGNKVWNLAYLIRSPEGEKTKPHLPKGSFYDTYDEAMQAVQQGMSAFLLKATKGLNFWNNLERHDDT